MRAVRKVFDRLNETRALAPFRPLVVAADEFFFGAGRTTPGPPHIMDALDLKRYMSAVIIALLPSAAASVYFFGLRAVEIIVVSYLVGGLVEAAFAIARKKEIHEGFLVTGLIYPLILPPTVPLWIVAVGIAVGVFFGKEVFGGTGRNVFNPALVGRLFITISFPAIMTTAWRTPFMDGVTSATPLVVFRSSGELASSADLLLGQAAGSMGEIFRAGVILGGIFLMVTRVSNWRVPLSYLGAVALVSAVGNAVSPAVIAPPLFQLLAGGLLFGAFFMATDPVTSPFTGAGKYVFGAGCGVLTVLIRSFSGFVEGVMFSIILMNALSPLIDHMIMKYSYQPVKR